MNIDIQKQLKEFLVSETSFEQNRDKIQSLVNLKDIFYFNEILKTIEAQIFPLQNDDSQHQFLSIKLLDIIVKLNNKQILFWIEKNFLEKLKNLCLEINYNQSSDNKDGKKTVDLLRQCFTEWRPFFKTKRYQLLLEELNIQSSQKQLYLRKDDSKKKSQYLKNDLKELQQNSKYLSNCIEKLKNIYWKRQIEFIEYFESIEEHLTEECSKLKSSIKNIEKNFKDDLDTNQLIFFQNNKKNYQICLKFLFYFPKLRKSEVDYEFMLSCFSIQESDSFLNQSSEKQISQEENLEENLQFFDTENSKFNEFNMFNQQSEQNTEKNLFALKENIQSKVQQKSSANNTQEQDNNPFNDFQFQEQAPSSEREILENFVTAQRDQFMYENDFEFEKQLTVSGNLQLPVESQPFTQQNDQFFDQNFEKNYSNDQFKKIDKQYTQQDIEIQEQIQSQTNSIQQNIDCEQQQKEIGFDAFEDVQQFSEEKLDDSYPQIYRNQNSNQSQSNLQRSQYPQEEVKIKEAEEQVNHLNDKQFGFSNFNEFNIDHQQNGDQQEQILLNFQQNSQKFQDFFENNKENHQKYDQTKQKQDSNKQFSESFQKFDDFKQQDMDQISQNQGKSSQNLQNNQQIQLKFDDMFNQYNDNQKNKQENPRKQDNIDSQKEEHSQSGIKNEVQVDKNSQNNLIKSQSQLSKQLEEANFSDFQSVKQSDFDNDQNEESLQQIDQYINQNRKSQDPPLLPEDLRKEQENLVFWQNLQIAEKLKGDQNNPDNQRKQKESLSSVRGEFSSKNLADFDELMAVSLRSNDIFHIKQDSLTQHSIEFYQKNSSQKKDSFQDQKQKVIENQDKLVNKSKELFKEQSNNQQHSQQDNKLQSEEQKPIQHQILQKDYEKNHENQEEISRKDSSLHQSNRQDQTQLRADQQDPLYRPRNDSNLVSNRKSQQQYENDQDSSKNQIKDNNQFEFDDSKASQQHDEFFAFDDTENHSLSKSMKEDNNYLTSNEQIFQESFKKFPQNQNLLNNIQQEKSDQWSTIYEKKEEYYDSSFDQSQKINKISKNQSKKISIKQEAAEKLDQQLFSSELEKISGLSENFTVLQKEMKQIQHSNSKISSLEKLYSDLKQEYENFKKDHFSLMQIFSEFSKIKQNQEELHQNINMLNKNKALYVNLQTEFLKLQAELQDSKESKKLSQEIQNINCKLCQLDEKLLSQQNQSNFNQLQENMEKILKCQSQENQSEIMKQLIQENAKLKNQNEENSDQRTQIQSLSKELFQRIDLIQSEIKALKEQKNKSLSEPTTKNLEIHKLENLQKQISNQEKNFQNLQKLYQNLQESVHNISGDLHVQQSMLKNSKFLYKSDLNKNDKGQESNENDYESMTFKEKLNYKREQINKQKLVKNHQYNYNQQQILVQNYHTYITSDKKYSKPFQLDDFEDTQSQNLESQNIISFYKSEKSHLQDQINELKDSSLNENSQNHVPDLQYHSPFDNNLLEQSYKSYPKKQSPPNQFLQKTSPNHLVFINDQETHKISQCVQIQPNESIIRQPFKNSFYSSNYLSTQLFYLVKKYLKDKQVVSKMDQSYANFEKKFINSMQTSVSFFKSDLLNIKKSCLKNSSILFENFDLLIGVKSNYGYEQNSLNCSLKFVIFFNVKSPKALKNFSCQCLLSFNTACVEKNPETLQYSQLQKDSSFKQLLIIKDDLENQTAFFPQIYLKIQYSGFNFKRMQLQIPLPLIYSKLIEFKQIDNQAFIEKWHELKKSALVSSIFKINRALFPTIHHLAQFFPGLRLISKKHLYSSQFSLFKLTGVICLKSSINFLVKIKLFQELLAIIEIVPVNQKDKTIYQNQSQNILCCLQFMLIE